MKTAQSMETRNGGDKEVLEMGFDTKGNGKGSDNDDNDAQLAEEVHRV